MTPFQKLLYIIIIVALGFHTTAVPVEPSSTAKSAEDVNYYNEQKTVNITAPVTSTPAPELVKDINISNSNQEKTYVLPEHPPSSGAGSITFDPSIYGGYLTPEAFQQYLAQFAGAFVPYGYPGYGPAPVYPAPYAVQTGYDGFLVPSPSSTNLLASGTVSSNSRNILTSLTNFIPTLMAYPIFRVIVSVIVGLLMLVFGGVVTTAICNMTPLCDISLRAVTYLRGNDAANVGHMLAEKMTPERVRRASEFVQNAIRKYKEMQKIIAEENNLN